MSQLLSRITFIINKYVPVVKRIFKNWSYLEYIYIYTVKPEYKKGTLRKLKMCPLWAVAFYIQVKITMYSLIGKMWLSFIDSDLLYRGASCLLYTGWNYNEYALFINGGNMTALYKQWFVIYRCPLKAGLTVYDNLWVEV